MSDAALTHQSAPCRCSNGWVLVDDDYVAQQAAKARNPDGSIAGDLLPALRNSTRPCHQCQPANYERWRQGQLVGQGVRRVSNRRRSRRPKRDEKF
jgi:hypothetical protein